jgi:hypothetical protein
MSKVAFFLTLLATVLVCLLPAVPAQAQAARTFVSAAGSDSNSCTNVATPCRHFAAAYAATAPNGEIDVLDPANYGALTITGPVSIEGHGWASIAPAANSAAIVINANPGDKINIIGVVLDGAGVANANGIQFNSGGSLSVRDCVIRNFNGFGINWRQNSSTLSQFFVSRTLISDNASYGIFINPNGSGTTAAVLDHVEIENSRVYGISAETFTQTINVTISDSVSANNGSTGITAFSQNGTPVTIMVRNSTIANNVEGGLSAAGAGAIVSVTRSTITGNSLFAWTVVTGCCAPPGGVVSSYGDNNIDGNASANTEPPNPLAYK